MQLKEPIGLLPDGHRDFADYRALAREVLADFERWRSSAAYKADCDVLRRHMRRIADCNERRAIRQAERCFAAGGRTHRWCGDLFLAFRDRTAMIDYLRFQECAYFKDGEADPLGVLTTSIRENMLPLGKGRAMIARVGLTAHGKPLFRIDLNFDPFQHLRASYCLVLRAQRSGRRSTLGEKALILFNTVAASAKLTVLRWSGNALFRHSMRQPEGRIASWLRQSVVKASSALDDVFAADRISGHYDRKRFVAECESYLTTRFKSLLQALPTDLVTNGSMAKFAKVFVGTLLGRAIAAPKDLQNATGYAIDSLKIAYCWGSTYPLVDDILDSAETSPQMRSELIAVMRHHFYDMAMPGAPSSPSVRELDQRMSELLSLVGDTSESLKFAVRNVFDAHVADSGLRLSMGAVAIDSDERFEVALLKSMLVRVATMVACGIAANSGDLVDMARVAVFNQLGDDIWDAAEDLDADRVTPVTAYLRFGGRDAYRFYHEFGAYLGSVGAGTSGRAAALAIAHTHRLAEQAGSPETRSAQIAALRAFAPELAHERYFGALPPVDPDSLIFDLERLLASLGSRAWPTDAAEEQPHVVAGLYGASGSTASRMTGNGRPRK